MPPVNRNLNQRSRQALYSLKREYGARIDIYKLNDSETNVRTGVKTQDVTVIPVNRAVALPERVNRTAPVGISRFDTRESQAGGHYDVGTRDFIVDRLDVPTLPELTPNDWIVYDGRKFQIDTVNFFEVRAGWIITTHELVGEIPERPEVPVTDAITLASDASASVEEA